jgi:hypothetical protein
VFPKDSQCAWLTKGASGRRVNDDGLVVGEDRMTEGILAVALFLWFADVNCDGGE